MTNSSSDEDAVSTPDAALNELSSNLDPTPPIETKGKSCESSSESTESDGDDSDEVAPVIPSLREIGIAEAPEWDDGLPDFAKQDIGTPLIRRLCAFGPIVALSIIFFISAAAVYLHTMWWPLVSIDGVAHLAVFMAWIYATLNNFLLSVRVGGGYVPRRWNPPADSTPDFSQRLQWCKICEGFKPPRSHHCSKCGRCVMKMDHHCLWINNCVGHRNHCFFVRFLLSAILGCAHATIILGHSLYHAINIGWYIRYGDGTEPIVELSFTSFLVCVSAIALAMGVTVALSILLFVQAKCIKKNMTGVEEYICEKAKARMREERHRGANFIFPYDIGWRRNIKEVMSSFSGKQCGTGIWWPIRQDCTQFSFSEEQLRQKKLKRQHARFVNITKSCKGGLCGAFSVSIKAFICQPLSDESRLAVVEGEKWIVTGGNKHWLYGFCEGTNRKGWFPRQCAELLDERPHLD